MHIWAAQEAINLKEASKSVVDLFSVFPPPMNSVAWFACFSTLLHTLFSVFSTPSWFVHTYIPLYILVELDDLIVVSLIRQN